jgi:U3 small nucleolar RNA-associated protein 14
MPGNPKRRKRPDSTKQAQNGVKKSKMAGGVPRVRKSDISRDYDSGSASEQEESFKAELYSDSEDERLGNVGEEGIDLSELMDIDETPVTRPDSNRPTAEHSQMLRTLRKGLGLDYAAQRAKAREDAKSIAPARPENAFSVSAEGASKVDLSDLMSSPGFSKETKKGLEKLSRSERRLHAEGTKESKARLERSVQYEDTKQLLSEWLPTVQTMRQADSVLFPLPEQIPKREKPSTSGSTASFTPQTELEKTIFGILEESGVTEAKLQQAEDLATKRLSDEEIRARHQQLARLRSLFFYQEQKNKRQAKIKSKKYRKLLKKAKEKNEPTLAELEELDPEAYAAELEKMDRARAEERIGIKHAHLGKWAKHALRSKDPHTMQAVRDHLEHGRRLKKKMETDRDGSDEDSSDDSDVSSLHDSDLENSDAPSDDDQDAGEPGDIVDINGNIISSKPKTKKNQEDDEEAGGVFAMKFMQRASAKRQADHDELMTQMDHEMYQRKRALKAQRKQAKDDFDGEGLKADSDSDDETPKSRRASKDMESEDEIAPAQPAPVTVRGRRSVASTATQVSASALAGQSRYDSDEDQSSSMVMDHVNQGFTASVKGRLSVSQSSSRSAAPSHATHVESGDDSYASDDSESPDGSHVFKPNSRAVDVSTAKASKSTPKATSSKAAKSTASQSKASASLTASKQSKGSSSGSKRSTNDLDEDEVLIGSISAGGGMKSTLEAETSDNEESVIDISRPSGKSNTVDNDSDNPWMVVEEDDEGLVIPGTVSLAKAAQGAKGKPSKSKPKKTEDRVAVDLEQVARKLKAEEAKQDAVFNLSAASATSKAQRELIERAFAGDHLTEAEIAAEKMQAVEEANEVEEQYKTLTLPGWGEWAGTHVKPSALRQRLVKEMEVKKQARSEEIMASRRDAKLKHAIVSDKQHGKQFAMYQARSVPAEFKDNAALYEASLRQPMGKEWNVRDSHAKLVKPKFVAIPGLVIEPIQKKREGIQRK